MFEYLFKPIKINSVTIKNRIAYPSLALLYSYDRKLNRRHMNFYAERARGGAGIVTVGPVGIDYLGSGLLTPGLDTDDAIPDFRALAEKIRGEGAAAWVQLYHAGGYSHSMMIGKKQAIAPSSLPSKYTRETPREMTLEEIRTVQEAFISAAARAKEAGFDGVEIIGSAGYLITQFLSPLKNKRTDQYGGSFSHRVRFAREIIEGMRKRLGPGYPITIRMAGNDFVPGSNSSRETPEIAKAYEEAGIDAINVTGGWHETQVPQITMDVPRGGFSYLAGLIKRAVSVPVMASNRIPDPYLAEEIIRNGVADMVNLGRVLLADPQWPRKVKEGRVDEIRPCIACNQGCMDEIFSGKPALCQVNPFTGFEGERKIEKAAEPRKVMVIGAGPAGLEAAVTAATAGHKVEIYEKEGSIGGQLVIAGMPPRKGEIWELLRYYDEMVFLHGIELHLNTKADLALMKKKKPDFVIVAEGAEPAVPPIDGIEGTKVISAWDVLKNEPMLGRRVAVIGGGSIGLETALYIAERGTITPETLHFLFTHQAESMESLRELMTRGNIEVTVFEMQSRIGSGIGKSTRWAVIESLDRLGITVHTETEILSVRDGIVRFRKGGTEDSIQFDHVVIAAGSRSRSTVAGMLKESGIPHAVAGDGVRPAKILDAVHEGFLAAAGIR